MPVCCSSICLSVCKSVCLSICICLSYHVLICLTVVQEEVFVLSGFNSISSRLKVQRCSCGKLFHYNILYPKIMGVPTPRAPFFSATCLSACLSVYLSVHLLFYLSLSIYVMRMYMQFQQTKLTSSIYILQYHSNTKHIDIIKYMN